MKILCLHGAIANPDVFGVQLGPLMKELTKNDSASFVFAQGGVRVKPPPGFEEYFGPGPHYRHLDDAGIAESAMLKKVRDFPEEATPEDTLRTLKKNQGGDEAYADPYKAIDPLYEIMEQEGDIEGVLGYSEGAIAAGTLILDEQRRAAKEGRESRLKLGIFIGGWPPLLGNGELALADECDDMLEAHTIHVIGANDPWLQGAMALYNLCDEDTAQMFDHGHGHVIPRDQNTVQELAETMGESIEKIREDHPKPEPAPTAVSTETAPTDAPTITVVKASSQQSSESSTRTNSMTSGGDNSSAASTPATSVESASSPETEKPNFDVQKATERVEQLQAQTKSPKLDIAPLKISVASPPESPTTDSKPAEPTTITPFTAPPESKPAGHGVAFAAAELASLPVDPKTASPRSASITTLLSPLREAFPKSPLSASLLSPSMTESKRRPSASWRHSFSGKSQEKFARDMGTWLKNMHGASIK